MLETLVICTLEISSCWDVRNTIQRKFSMYLMIVCKYMFSDRDAMLRLNPLYFYYLLKLHFHKFFNKFCSWFSFDNIVSVREVLQYFILKYISSYFRLRFFNLAFDKEGSELQVLTPFMTYIPTNNGFIIKQEKNKIKNVKLSQVIFLEIFKRFICHYPFI